MKKWLAIWLGVVLCSCMNAPTDVFTDSLNLGEKIVVPVQSVEVVDLTKTHDSKHYIQNKWPQVPQQMLIRWGQENLKTAPSSDRLIVVIQQADVVREELAAPHWYEKDEVKDTLIYQVEFIVKTKEKTKKTFTVGGKNFVQMPAKFSLADKEKEWVKLANKMFENLNQQVRLKLKNVV